MSALVAYDNSPFMGDRRTRDAATIVSGALMQFLFLRGQTPTSNGFAQPVQGSSTRSAPALVIEPMGVSTAEAILELRRLSGLTWDELANAFGVSRRAVHHWASGSTLTPEHLKKVHRALHMVRRLSQGASADLRERLLTPLVSGTTGLDLLRAGDYDGVEWAIGGVQAPTAFSTVPPRASGSQPPLSAALATLEDRPVRSVRSSRVVKTVRIGKATDPR